MLSLGFTCAAWWILLLWVSSWCSSFTRVLLGHYQSIHFAWQQFSTTTVVCWWSFGILMVILERHDAVSCVRASPLEATNWEGMGGPALRMQSVCNADHHLVNSKHHSNICAAELIQLDPAWNKKMIIFFLLEETQIPELTLLSLSHLSTLCALGHCCFTSTSSDSSGKSSCIVLQGFL